MNKSLKTNPSYKAQAHRAVSLARPLIQAGDFAGAARLVVDFHRGATPNKLKSMRYSPQAVALRALGLRLVKTFPVYGGNNATYIAGTARVYAHKSGWEGRL